MILVDDEFIQSYKINDHVLALMNDISIPTDQNLTSHKWLEESLNKRAIFSFLYKSILDKTERQYSVLDVGGGLSCFTRRFVSQHKYKLCEIFAHEETKTIEDFEKQHIFKFIFNKDWMELGKEKFDLVIANDIFPNVDQRLDIFLTEWLPFTKKMLLSLTWYPGGKYFPVKRINADEIFYIVPWNAKQLIEALRPFSDRITNFEEHLLLSSTVSVYPNGRQVCCVELKGDISDE